jgi:ABC-2 type transport system ATP-binding protein
MMKPPENGPAAAVQPDTREVVAAMNGVSKFFDSYQVRALMEIHFEVRRGEVFGLLGPEGSGKSTALKILAGRLRPTEGRATVFGRSPRRAAIKVRIGYLPQHTGQERESVFGRGLEFIKKFLTRLDNRQRGEMDGRFPDPRRRLSLKQAILGSRDLVLLDEPFLGLDPAGCREAKELILTLARRGKTVIFTAGSLSDSRDICNRIAIFYEGKIQAVGTLGELLAMPDALRFTAPVLPRPVSERVLKMIREELGAEPVFAEKTAESLEARLPGDPRVKTSSATPTTEELLTPLVKQNAAKPSSEPPAAVTDPVNHEKLEELTKPANRFPQQPV